VLILTGPDNAELGHSPGFVREKTRTANGTHVAGTAQERSRTVRKIFRPGPDADIIVVKGGNGSFSESDDRRLTYAQNRASALGKPIVVTGASAARAVPTTGPRVRNAINTFGPLRTCRRCCRRERRSEPDSHRRNAGRQPRLRSRSCYTPGAAGRTSLFDLWLNSNTNVSVSAHRRRIYRIRCLQRGLSSGDAATPQTASLQW